MLFTLFALLHTKEVKHGKSLLCNNISKSDQCQKYFDTCVTILDWDFDGLCCQPYLRLPAQEVALKR